MSGPRDDLVAWYNADKERAQVAYAAADSATLAALLPVLEADEQRNRDEMDRWQKWLDEEPEKLAALEEARSEALAAWSHHADEPGVADSIAEIGAKFRGMIDESRNSSEMNMRGAIDLQFYLLAALFHRNQLVRAELTSRGLLPDMPSV